VLVVSLILVIVPSCFHSLMLKALQEIEEFVLHFYESETNHL
jgi:hypothetical protein